MFVCLIRCILNTVIILMEIHSISFAKTRETVNWMRIYKISVMRKLLVVNCEIVRRRIVMKDIKSCSRLAGI